MTIVSNPTTPVNIKSTLYTLRRQLDYTELYPDAVNFDTLRRMLDELLGDTKPKYARITTPHAEIVPKSPIAYKKEIMK